MDILLKIVRSNELLEIRSKVLRNNTSHENCKFNGDNKKSSVHIGAYRNDQIVGGISIIKNNCNYKELKNCYQLRGMCVLDNFQNNGIGNKILNEAEKQCKNLDINNIWMNARIKAAPFYLKSNYIDLGIRYEIKGIGLHGCLYKELK
jgi:GNAT superfamily N-acetyltransferase|tara:strand:+ start:2089 stop:2532 length:444 start_codon:yes stop_codon:yes gene_type:complete